MDCVSLFKFMSHDFGFGFGFGCLVFGCFKQLFNLIFLFLFINLGLKAFQFGFHFKGLFKFLYEFKGKTASFTTHEPSLLEMVKKSEPKQKISETKLKKLEIMSNGGFDDEYGAVGNVDEVFDVLSLRKMVKRERWRADDAYTELDKERVAAATAADEAMVMILRVQKEKSLIEMEANQYRRLVEEKRNHDQEVIQSLRWMVLKHESERGCLENQLRFYKRKFKVLPSENKNTELRDENDERLSFFNSRNGEGSPWHGLVSSLDFDLTTP